MSKRRLSIFFVACLIVAAALVLCWRRDPGGDRTHLRKWRSYGASASALNKLAHFLGGRSRLTPRLEKLQHRYERESEAEMQALIDSGYLVRISFPVTNLSSHREEVSREWFSLPSHDDGGEPVGDNVRLLGLNEASNLVTIVCRPNLAADFAILFRWRSADSSLSQRADSALRVAPIGTRQSEAERILGRPTRHGHFRAARAVEPAYASLTNDLELPAGELEEEAQNLWCDFYDFPGGGYVCFAFDAKGKRPWAERPLTRVWFGQTNDAQTIGFPKQ